jgi:hypothetical protein
MLNGDGEGPLEVFKGKKLCQVMDKFITLFSLNVKILVTSFKHRLGNRGHISSIFAFKAHSGYRFIQEVVFQGNRLERKCFYSKCMGMEVVVVVM